MNQSESINELATALSKAQGELKNSALDKKNSFRGNDYSSLTAVWGVCRDPLSKNGLSVTQCPFINNEWTCLETTLLHTSGQWMKSTVQISRIEAKMEDFGKAMTYARRYALCCIVGVSPSEEEEDDGAAEASGKTKPKEEPRQTINKDQIAQISSLVNKMDKEGIKAFMDFLNKDLKVTTIIEIPKEEFENCTIRINRRIKYIEDLKKEEKPQ